MSKKLRFEVFKRDSFTCQYCGKKAPDVVLEIDHIEPVARGGEDTHLNLTTACWDCNRGKGARELSDDSMVAKQRRQMEDLQDRQEQIQMLVQWQRSLVDIDAQALDEAESFWCDLADWLGVNEEGKADLRKLIRKHGYADVIAAMRDAVHYFKYDDEGSPTNESANAAFHKIGGIIRIKQAEAEKPWLKDLFYTRGIVRNRMYCKDHVAKALLEEAYAAGVPTEESRVVALTARNWTTWQEEMRDLIDTWDSDQEPGA